MIKIYTLLLSVLLFINAPLVIANSAPVVSLPDNSWLEQRMSLNCNDRPLKEVLTDVAAFFQVEIVYQAEGAELSVQCLYSMATVEQILDRLFRKENRAFLIEFAPKRKIIVQIFGVSEYNIVSNDGTNTTQSIPFLANMTNKALVAMQNEQLKKYREELKDPDAIIPGVGITRAKITKLHQQQIQQYEKSRHDPDQNVAGTEMTQQQLRAVQEQQLYQYEQEKLDQNQIDPFTGLTTAEMSELHHQQMQQYLSK